MEYCYPRVDDLGLGFKIPVELLKVSNFRDKKCFYPNVDDLWLGIRIPVGLLQFSKF